MGNEDFVITADVIQKEIEIYLLHEYGKLGENHHEIRVECNKLPEKTLVRRYNWYIHIKSQTGYVKAGPNLLNIYVFAPDKIYRKFSVLANLRTFDRVVVAKRTINRHQVVTLDDIKLEMLETTRLKKPFFRNLVDVVGYRTRQIIPEGQIILPHMIESPPLIEQGDIVDIRIFHKNIQAKAVGKALKDGWKGDVIPVKNISSGKKVMGKVIDEQTVVVKM